MAHQVDGAHPAVTKVAEVLQGTSEPHLLTGDQYKESLRDGRRVVDSTDSDVEDVVTHPDLRAVNTLAKVMDRQFDPTSALTYTDEHGDRRAVGWQVPTKQEHLWPTARRTW